MRRKDETKKVYLPYITCINDEPFEVIFRSTTGASALHYLIRIFSDTFRTKLTLFGPRKYSDLLKCLKV